MMNTKRIYAICAMLLTASALFANEQLDTITVDEDHSKHKITLTSGSILFVDFEPYTEDEGFISLSIENIREEELLLFFGKSFDEKYLKGMKPKVQYDKNFPGSKEYRLTSSLIGLKGEVVKVEPSDKTALIAKKPIQAGETVTFSLPIYIAKQKKKKGVFTKNGITLMDTDVVELYVYMKPPKPDEELIKLRTDADGLFDRLKERPFCTHQQHKMPLDEQIQQYSDERDMLVGRIDSITRERGLLTTDNRYKPYNELRTELSEIDLWAEEYQTDDCGNTIMHKTVQRAPRHKCKYCGLSLAQIYQKLEDYYQYVYSNRSAKSSVMADVKMLYNCCTDKRCSKHAAAWNKGGKYRAKITDRYKRISAF